jgi:hypothetical protein
MKRREFLILSSIAAGGLSLRMPLSTALPALKRAVIWKIYEDGTFDILSDKISLLSCYPSMNDKAVSVRSYRVDRNDDGICLIYELLEGSLELTFRKDDNSIFIDTAIKGMKQAPLNVNPVGNAQISGAVRFFKQGLGFGGPSGIFDLKSSKNYHDSNHISEQSWSYDSYMCSALIGPDNSTLSFGAYDHSAYQQRSSFSNDAHRQGLTDQKIENSEKFFLNSGFLTEKIPVPAEGIKLPGIHFIFSDSPFASLQQLAVDIAKASKARTDKPSMYSWDAWYEYFEDFDSRKLDDFLEGLKSIQPAIPLKAIALTAGYCIMGDWFNADARIMPNGIEGEVKKIIDSGNKAGIWIGPFMVSSKSRLYKEHPDWILKGNDGKPLLESKGPKGMIDNLVVNEERYFLDASHPEAMEYLRNIFRTYKSWGVSFYKVDFLEWGLKNSADVKRYTPGKTSVQYFREVMDMIRQEIGEDSYFLGCIAPFAPCIGIVDGIRVAYDTHYKWDPEGSTQNMFNETIADQYFNNIFWQNDPDVVLLRHSQSNQSTDEEVKTLAYWCGILGGVISASDRFHRLQDYRLKLWRFIQPSAKANTGKFVFWYDNKHKLQYIVRDYKNGSYALLAANLGGSDVEETISLQDAVNEKELNCFDWEPGKFGAPVSKQTITFKLKPHDSRLIYLSKNKTAAAANTGLSGEVVEGL